MNTPAYFAMDDLVLSPATSATGRHWTYYRRHCWKLDERQQLVAGDGSHQRTATVTFAGTLARRSR